MLTDEQINKISAEFHLSVCTGSTSSCPAAFIPDLLRHISEMKDISDAHEAMLMGVLRGVRTELEVHANVLGELMNEIDAVLSSSQSTPRKE